MGSVGTVANNKKDSAQGTLAPHRVRSPVCFFGTCAYNFTFMALPSAERASTRIHPGWRKRMRQ